MIVKMKKLTLLCTRASREATLDALRDLGAVHLQHVRPPEGGDLEEARSLHAQLKNILEVLPKHPHTPPSGKSPQDAARAVGELIRRRQKLLEQIEALEPEIRRYEPFGSFSPETVRDLAADGVSVSLCHLPLKALPKLPEEVLRIELSRDRMYLYAALLVRGELPPEVETVPLPGKPLDEMKQELAGLKAGLEETDARFSSYAGDHHAVASLMADAADQVQYLEARAGMGDSEHVFYLRGFFPAEREPDLRAEAAEKGWAVLVEEPAADDRVPTLLRNPKWVQTIKPLMDMVNLTPGYHEVDISPAFLVFFCIFFGMLVGDAGYGLLFLVLTTFSRFRFKTAPRALFNLLTVTSLATIVWGAVTGVWFGISNPPGVLGALHLSWLDDYYHLMGFCFLIGAVHLTLAHGWQAFIKRRTPQIFSEIGWIGSTWAMFFVAADMISGWPMPGFTVGLLVVSVILIVLFMTPPQKLKADWIRHAMLPLDVINNFVDVVSYLRLFAVGLATLEVARAFNGMASGAGWFGAMLILFAGHTMNIAMAVMGVMVHGLRLNALEFSNHVGLEWAGRKFNPFTRIKKQKGGEG